MTKKEFQRAIAIAGLKQWQIAEAVGISEYTLCKYLRKDLNEEMTAKVKKAIEELSEED